MGLKLQVEKIEDIEEAFRPLYEEKEGKFHLTLDDKIEDAVPLKKALENARRIERERNKEIDNWKKLGKTPDEIQEMATKLEELESLRLESKGDFETLKAQWLEKNQGTITKAQKEAQDAKAETALLKQEREQDRLNGVIDRAIVAAKGKLRPLQPIVRQFVKIEHEDGQAKFVVIDENGTPRFNLSGPNDGKLMTIPELVADLATQEEYAGIFEGSGNSGGGGKSASGGNNKAHGNIRRKADLGSGAEYTAKFADFIKSFPTEAEGVKAYHALPD